jgi:hypothetical protein
VIVGFSTVIIYKLGGRDAVSKLCKINITRLLSTTGDFIKLLLKPDRTRYEKFKEKLSDRAFGAIPCRAFVDNAIVRVCLGRKEQT